jgi:glycosyltransferase involved in cell wall biosynthesis
MRLSVIIPAYNEEGNLEHCVQVLEEKLASFIDELELIIVNDGSLDSTGELADQLARRHANIQVVQHEQNLGVGGAFMSGLRLAHGDWVILIPADLALHPDELPRYIEAAEGADVVVGLRSDRSDYTLLRRLVSWTNIFLIQRLFGVRLRQFQYISMYRREIFTQIEVEYWRSAFFLAEILIKALALKKTLVEVDIRYAPRVSGQPTGAKLALILLTLRDIFLYWVRVQTDNAKSSSRSKRPLGVTLLASGVLSLAVLFSARLGFALQRWDVIGETSSVPPAYIALTGVLGSSCGWILTWGLWRGAGWAARLARRMVWAYLGYVWLETLVISLVTGQASNELRAWLFQLGLSILLVLCVYLALSTYQAKLFFGEINE